MHNYINSFIILLITALISGCGGDKKESVPETPARIPSIGSAAVTEVAGLFWIIPQDWQAEADRPMRVATYKTPSAPGDSDPGEIAVFYFGPDEGGSVEANVDRWFNQFEQPTDIPQSESSTRENLTVNGIPVTIVRTSGTYTAAAGPMVGRQDVRPGYKLIGAIAEGPQGAVFFKFTGPASTIDSGEEDFMTLVRSISRK
jgi:hypothetical protein